MNEAIRNVKLKLEGSNFEYKIEPQTYWGKIDILKYSLNS